MVRLLLMSAGLIGLACTAGRAEPPTADDVQRLADRIDSRIAERWKAEDITPAPLADDAEFLRRVHLDLAGRIPAVAEVRAFLADRDPDKRRKVVDRLLESPAYVTHFANVWRAVLIPEASADPELSIYIPAFEAWLREKLRENASYADLAREIVTVPLDGESAAGMLSPIGFYQAKRGQPENLAAATARMFLGVRIECAQCHHHPFDEWKQERFWSYAAFFAGLEAESASGPAFPLRESPERRSLTIPETGETVQAAYLDGGEPQWTSHASTREALAHWLTARDNPWFAAAGANRLWGHFFGVGLVDPVDDFSAHNPPSHPALLDELALAFAERDYDAKFLIRAITATDAYQLTSRQTHPSQADVRLYARRAAKGLTAEQIYDSVLQATGGYEPFGRRDAIAGSDASRRGEFLETFANESESPIAQQATVLQALMMMNGRVTAEATGLERGALLAAVADYPLMDTAQRIETLFLATLSRRPTERELERLVPYVETGGRRDDRVAALGDTFWALLNSAEFRLNH